MLQQFESDSANRAWREKLRNDVQSIPADKPLYAEPFLAARWFSDTYAKHFGDLNDPIVHEGKPFAEVLLDAVENPSDAASVRTGTRFEAAAGLQISSTPGFEVDSARETTEEQVDLVVVFTPEPWAPLGLEAGCGLVECKSSAGKVGVSDLRDFGAKCLFHRVSFGILVRRWHHRRPSRAQ